ncbi:MAG TPA: hypothetical protein VJ697_02960 [Nitrososphaeraceae archaeon]|nr:hypothetical protein [Nitrososphaeraceae archaeon]
MSSNIFEFQGLLEAIISDLQEIKQELASTQKAIAKLRADFIRSGILRKR